LPDYLDTSAFIKLVRSEPESAALRSELAGRELLSSALLVVEGRRAARRYGELAARRARVGLTALTLLPLDRGILDAAADLGPAELRSLDALHLATVLSLGEDLERLYCYDARLTAAAQALGIVVSRPR
jgi:predicted nucleic acid-binding protein